MTAVAKTLFASAAGGAMAKPGLALPASRVEVVAWLRAHPALKPQLTRETERLATGLPALDALLQGGLPCGAITELVGKGSSGRTSLSLAILGQATRRGEVVAWVDPQDALDPLSAMAAGVDLDRLLWIRPTGSEALKLGLSAADLVLDAGGFASLVLDLAGSRWRAALGNPSSWVRLVHRLERSRTALILLAPQEVAGTTAALRLECLHEGQGGTMRVHILKQRQGAPGAEVRLALGDAVD